MLSLSFPLWLLALSALPLVWWLHRFHELDRTHKVAALFLWPGGDAPGQEQRPSRRADPRWILRALTTALVVLALCGPRWSSRDTQPLIIWVDDSASMFTQEPGGTRMAQALAALAQQWENHSYHSITARSLAVPGESLKLDSFSASARAASLQIWAQNSRGEPHLPTPALMDSGAIHWLVSDGASPGLADWAQQAAISRHFGAGDTTENVGISRMSVRRNGAVDRGEQLLVTVANGGEEMAERALEIHAGALRPPLLALRIDGGAIVHTTIDLPARFSANIRAGISPGDALPLDDSLVITAQDLRRATVTTGADCDDHLRAALATHPALLLADDEPAADLGIYCGAGDVERRGPALQTGAGPGSAPLQGPLAWHPAAGTLRELTLDPDWLLARPGNTPAGDELILLRSADRPLILFDAARNIVEVRLDLAAPDLVDRPEYPLLIAGLVDVLLAETADAVVSVAHRHPVAIAPRRLSLRPPPSATRTNPLSRDLTSALILAALLTLLLDPALTAWRSSPGPHLKPAAAR